MIITGAVRVDLTEHVDDIGELDIADLTFNVWVAAGGGFPVIIDIGTARHVHWGTRIHEALQDAGPVEVIGTNSTGVSHAVRALREAMATA